MKQIIQDITPPLLWKIAKHLHSFVKNREKAYIEWEYIPEGWQKAKDSPEIKGWNVESVLNAYEANWNNFLATLEGTLPFGISPESNSKTRNNLAFHNVIMTYAYALAIASRHKSSISMLDWGGAIGHYYPLSQKLIPDLTIDYHCKDVPILAEYGQKLFPDAHFYSDETCLERKYDFILASGSFQYSQDWVATLKGLTNATTDYLFITRFPIVQNTPSFVMIQRPYQYGYDTEYLSWCINRNDLLQVSKDLGLKIVQEFIVEQLPFVHNAPEQPEHWGFLFRKEIP